MADRPADAAFENVSPTDKRLARQKRTRRRTARSTTPSVQSDGAVRAALGEELSPPSGPHELRDAARPPESGGGESGVADRRLIASHVAVDGEDQALRAELEAIREQLEAMGPVNPLAIEEHEEEVKRLDFLTAQRADLAAARSSLQQAIREIDSTARELFLATFNQVRENFRQIFMTLFGGGECDLRLEHPEAPLDCDIEIHASPAESGTSHHLLSRGGERPSSRVMLFASPHQASPFCCSTRSTHSSTIRHRSLMRMLNQLKQSTVSSPHNPRTTTEAADAVYGVTMQEPGVSSLVSVRLRGGASVDEALEGRLVADEATVGAGA